MRKKINKIADVVAYQLCTGCGICAYLEPEVFRMVDSLELGRRPVPVAVGTEESGVAFAACPGVALSHAYTACDTPLDDRLRNDWGPVLAVWEGYAADPEIRFNGSSGGAVTALALYCLEAGRMASVIHTKPSSDDPRFNSTAVSRSRAELLGGAGSRYSPSSPAEGLAMIGDDQGAPSVFVGKPCDVAAVAKASAQDKQLRDKLGLLVAFFCAGVPSHRGTLDLLRRQGADENTSVTGLRYRGRGWPGLWTADFVGADGESKRSQLTYQESWGFLQKYRQWRCYICPDHTGEFADLAVGDPWYRKVAEGEAGKSLIVVRSQRGMAVLQGAAQAGYLVLEKCDASLLPASQPNLLKARGGLWGRLLALRLLGAAVPDYHGFHFFKLWLSSLTFREKLQSVFGTAKRVISKGLRHPLAVKEWSRSRHE